MALVTCACNDSAIISRCPARSLISRKTFRKACHDVNLNEVQNQIPTQKITKTTTQKQTEKKNKELEKKRYRKYQHQSHTYRIA